MVGSLDFELRSLLYPKTEDNSRKLNTHASYKFRIEGVEYVEFYVGDLMLGEVGEDDGDDDLIGMLQAHPYLPVHLQVRALTQSAVRRQLLRMRKKEKYPRSDKGGNRKKLEMCA